MNHTYRTGRVKRKLPDINLAIGLLIAPYAEGPDKSPLSPIQDAATGVEGPDETSIPPIQDAALDEPYQRLLAEIIRILGREHLDPGARVSRPLPGPDLRERAVEHEIAGGSSVGDHQGRRLTHPSHPPGMRDPALPVRRSTRPSHRPAPAPPPGVRPMSRPRPLPPKRRPRATSACHAIHTCPVSVRSPIRPGSRTA